MDEELKKDESERDRGTGKDDTTRSKPKPPTPNVPDPSNPVVELQEIPFEVVIEVSDVPKVPVTTHIVNLIDNMMSPKYDSYFDQRRIGKTLLNRSNDVQDVVVNWEPRDDNKIAIKLLNPLDIGVSTSEPIFISRELQNSILEVMRFIPVENVQIPQLRPSIAALENKKTKVSGTLSELIASISGISHSGSAHISGSNNKTYVTNQILEKHYNNSRISADINVDYSNFENFITFGSAERRLQSFVGKLTEIQDLFAKAPSSEIALGISGSANLSGSYDTVFGTLNIDASGSVVLVPTGSSVIPNISQNVSQHINTSILISQNILNLIRSFDQYEASLWFDSSLPYSSSDSTNVQSNEQYMADYTYPKILGLPYRTDSSEVSTWSSSLFSIASSYDDDNRNRLKYNVPQYLQEDTDSSAFLEFTDIVGHQFDNIAVYINKLGDIHSRNPNITSGLSGEIATYILESHGVKAPNISSIEKLVRYVTGDNTGSAAYKDISDEYYKRYLHALPHLLKTKGTSKSVDALLNVFGINPDILTIKESVSNRFTSIQSHEVLTTEQDFTLQFNSGSSIDIPFSSSLRSPQTVQMTVAFPYKTTTSSLLEFRNASGFVEYGIHAERHPDASTNTYYENTGRLMVVKAGTSSLMNTEYFESHDGQPFSYQIKNQNNTASLYVRKVENGLVQFTQSLAIPSGSSNLSPEWDSINSLRIGGGTSNTLFSGSLDEFRLWGEPISLNTFTDFANNPGIFAGESYSSSLYSLIGSLSFTLPYDVSSTDVINESPLLTITNSPDISNFSASGFDAASTPLFQTSRDIRHVLETTYNLGAASTTSDNIVSISSPFTNDTSVTVQDSYETGTNGTGFQSASNSPIAAAQSFKTITSGVLTSVDVKLTRNVSNPTGSLVVELYTHSGSFGTSSQPGTLITTSDPVSKSTIESTPTGDWATFSFSDNTILDTLTEYVIAVVDPAISTGTFSDFSNYISVKLDGTGTPANHQGNLSFLVMKSGYPVTPPTWQLVGLANYYEWNMDFRVKTVPEITNKTLSSTSILGGLGRKTHSGSYGDSRLDMSISPQDAVDRHIIRSYGNINLGDYVGNPQDRYAERYTELDDLHETFVTNLAPSIDYNNFIKFFDKFLHLFYDSVTEYLPARARVTKGIVIRPNILDRTKIISRTSIKMSGETTRRTDNALTSNDKDVVRSYDWVQEVAPTISTNVNAGLTSISDVLETSLLTNIVASSDDVYGYSTTGLDNFSFTLSRKKKQADMPRQGLYPNLGSASDPNSGSLFTFTEVSDFSDIESTTYFTRGTGLYYKDTLRFVPVTQSYMPTEPTVTTWVQGNRYTLGDVAIQPQGTLDSSGKLLSQNGKYFVFINQGFSQDKTVASTIAPQLDTQNWTRLRYVPETYQSVVRFAYVNGQASSQNVTELRDTTLPYDSVPQGHLRQHFRFTRDNSLGARRRTYEGTMNTRETTVDFKPPFEVFDININEIQVASPEACD